MRCGGNCLPYLRNANSGSDEPYAVPALHLDRKHALACLICLNIHAVNRDAGAPLLTVSHTEFAQPWRCKHDRNARDTLQLDSRQGIGPVQAHTQQDRVMKVGQPRNCAQRTPIGRCAACECLLMSSVRGVM
jgi:hypothetical protein